MGRGKERKARRERGMGMRKEGAVSIKGRREDMKETEERK